MVRESFLNVVLFRPPSASVSFFKAASQSLLRTAIEDENHPRHSCIALTGERRNASNWLLLQRSIFGFCVYLHLNRY